jgi:glucose-6-phosphate isomerase
MDLHFRNDELRRNLPVLLALVGVWNINFLDASAHAVLTYCEALERLPAYLQQLEMESNGKRVDRDGHEIDYRTAPVIWGGVGMNGQHAFFQQLHQGTGWTPLDFILVGGPDHGLKRQRDSVLANGLAQAEALMQGRDDVAARREHDDALSPYRVFPGNRPSTTILIGELDARRLGALIALYEHKVFTQSVVWNINPFDQFGVELGKKIASGIEPWLAGGKGDAVDPATRQLLERLKSNGQD